jgi:putative Holliday junction resolvase
VRIIGIDFGERRIGVAAADDRMRMAIPLVTILVDGDPVEAVVRMLEEERADKLVVGLPLSLTGAEGPQAQRIREVIAQLSERVALPIDTWDERLTTVQASRSRPAGQRGKGTGVGQDSIAAAILLQAYVDSLRPYE